MKTARSVVYACECMHVHTFLTLCSAKIRIHEFMENSICKYSYRCSRSVCEQEARFSVCTKRSENAAGHRQLRYCKAVIAQTCAACCSVCVTRCALHAASATQCKFSSSLSFSFSFLLTVHCRLAQAQRHSRPYASHL